MVKTLTFDAEAKPVQQQQRLVWSVALSPRTAAEAGLQQDEAADAPRVSVLGNLAFRNECLHSVCLFTSPNSLRPQLPDTYLSAPSFLPPLPPSLQFDVQRAMTPNLQACSAEERRTVFYGSLKDYAKNKVVGDLGSLKLGTGLRALAGLAR